MSKSETPKERSEQPTTKRTLRVRSATDEDLERHFGSGKLVIGFPVRPNEPTPPSSPSAGDDHSPETPEELRLVRGPHRVSPHGGEWEIHLRSKP
jgi:hypothetical protein